MVVRSRRGADDGAQQIDGGAVCHAGGDELGGERRDGIMQLRPDAGIDHRRDALECLRERRALDGDGLVAWCRDDALIVG